jgi:hypothetical protein
MLTREVFNLDASTTDYHDVLERLARERSIGEIEALFEKGLSSQARAYILSLKQDLE